MGKSFLYSEPQFPYLERDWTWCLGSTQGKTLPIPAPEGTPNCPLWRVWGRSLTKCEDRGAAAEIDSWLQVWLSALQVLPSGSLEECELGPICSSPDSELGGRSPVHTGPGQHLWRCVCWWVGPWLTIIRTFHSTCIKPVLFAPGRSLATACHLSWSVLPLIGQLTMMQTVGVCGQGTTVSHCRLPPAWPLVMSVQCLLCGHIWSHLCIHTDSGYNWYMLHLVTPGIFYPWAQRCSQSCLELSCGQGHLRHLGVSPVLISNVVRDCLALQLITPGPHVGFALGLGLRVTLRNACDLLWILPVLGLKVCLDHTWFMSVRSVYSSPVWSLPGAPWDQVRWSSGARQSCYITSGCVPRVGAMSDVSEEVLVLG